MGVREKQGLPGWAARLQQEAAQHPFVRRLGAFYRRHHRVAPLLFFFGGVAWDALTLNRIDAWIDVVLLLTYLLVLGGLILVAALVESEQARQPWCARYQAWYPPAIQFFLGALFSAYVVFYFQSASLTETSLFFALLVVLLVANEFIHRRLVNLYLLFALYFLAAFSFFIFFVPVVAKRMTYGTFVAGGVLSLALVGGMLSYLQDRGVFQRPRQFVVSLGLALALFGLLNLFYLQNWIPPVPLALRHGGVYHHASRQGDAYLLRYERPAWYEVWIDTDEVFHYAPGDTVFCFTAVFAPTQLTKKVYHQWRHYDAGQQAWRPMDRIEYRIVGGRKDGYRGYTYKRYVRPGRWRVDVETGDGRILGRIPFRIEPAAQRAADLKETWYR